ncbi:MAG TPA: low molecular weight protein-tyrosine-phosphatase [Segetibacter sp.]|jgi:protein-tyrosine phosphatase
MKILMVCLGNICRSPLAEGVLKDKIQKAGLDWEVDSAGTSHYLTGNPPHKLSQKIAKDKGIDICTQQCRQFVKQDMERFDKIYVMDEDNYDDVKRIAGDRWDEEKVDLLLNEAYPLENRSVPDPYYGVESDYQSVFEMIDKACEQILAPALKGEER